MQVVVDEILTGSTPASSRCGIWSQPSWRSWIPHLAERPLCVLARASRGARH